MIADVALVLALGWWVTLVYFFVMLKRAAGDPDLMVKVMRRMSSAQAKRKAATSDG